MKKGIIIGLLLCLLCVNSNVDVVADKTEHDVMGKKFSLSQVQEDYKIFDMVITKLLAPNKPFADHQEISKLLIKQSRLLHDNMSELEFFQVINPVVMQLHCGHTSLKFSKEYDEFLYKSGRFLPFIIKVIDKTIYVYSGLETNLPKGSEIVEINGHRSQDIIQTLLDGTTADGTNSTFKFAKINNLVNYFNYYFFVLIDPSSSFSVIYLTPQDRQRHETVLNGISPEQLKGLTAKHLPVTEKGRASFYGEFFNDYAILKVKTFVYNTDELRNKYRDFINSFFKELAEKKINNLILDLRNNGGGRLENAAYLYSHLIREANPYLSFSSDNGDLFLKLSIQPARNNFKGNLYILANGGCFSATGTLCSLLKFHHIGKFIGEETGGSYVGTSGGTVTTLKNTHIRIPDTVNRFETAVSGLTPGRGIFPDYPVSPTIEDYLNGNDVEMKLAIELIQKKQ